MGRTVAVGWGYSPGGTTPVGDASRWDAGPPQWGRCHQPWCGPALGKRMLAGVGGGSSPGGTTPEGDAGNGERSSAGCGLGSVSPLRIPSGRQWRGGLRGPGPSAPPGPRGHCPVAMATPPAAGAFHMQNAPQKRQGRDGGGAGGSIPAAGRGGPVRGSNPGGMSRSQPGAPTPSPGQDARCCPRGVSQSPADPPGSCRFPSPPAGCGCTRARSWWLIPG